MTIFKTTRGGLNSTHTTVLVSLFNHFSNYSTLQDLGTMHQKILTLYTYILQN